MKKMEGFAGMESGGFCWHGVVCGFKSGQMSFNISLLSTIGILLFMLRPGKTVNMTALPGLPAVLSGPKHVRSP